MLDELLICCIILGGMTAWFMLQLGVWYIWLWKKPISSAPRPVSLVFIGLAFSSLVFVAEFLVSLSHKELSFVTPLLMSIATLVVFGISSYALSCVLAMLSYFHRNA